MKHFLSLLLVMSLGVFQTTTFAPPKKKGNKLSFWEALSRNLNKHEELPKKKNYPAPLNAEILDLLAIIWPHDKCESVFDITADEKGLDNKNRFTDYAFCLGCMYGIIDTKERMSRYAALAAHEKDVPANLAEIKRAMHAAEKLYRLTLPLSARNPFAFTLTSFALGFLEGCAYQEILNTPTIVLVNIIFQAQEKFLDIHTKSKIYEIKDSEKRTLFCHLEAAEKEIFYIEPEAPEKNILNFLVLAYVNGLKSFFDLEDLEAFEKKCATTSLEEACAQRIENTRRIEAIKNDRLAERRSPKTTEEKDTSPPQTRADLLASPTHRKDSLDSYESLGSEEEEESLSEELFKELLSKLIEEAGEPTQENIFRAGFLHAVGTTSKKLRDILSEHATNHYKILILELEAADSTNKTVYEGIIAALDGIIEGALCKKNHGGAFKDGTDLSTEIILTIRERYECSGLAKSNPGPIDINILAFLRKQITEETIAMQKSFRKHMSRQETICFLEETIQSNIRRIKLLNTELDTKTIAKDNFLKACADAKKAQAELLAEQTTPEYAPFDEVDVDDDDATTSQREKLQASRRLEKQERILKEKTAREEKRAREERRREQEENIQKKALRKAAREAERKAQEETDQKRLAAEKAKRKQTKRDALFAEALRLAEAHKNLAAEAFLIGRNFYKKQKTDQTSLANGLAGFETALRRYKKIQDEIGREGAILGAITFHEAWINGYNAAKAAREKHNEEVEAAHAKKLLKK